MRAKLAIEAVGDAQVITGQVQDRMEALDVQIGALERSLASVQNVLNDFIDDTKTEEIPKDPDVMVGEDMAAAAVKRNKMRDLWNDIRAYVEDIASAPQIDGRTRAKYSRIDRRNYGRLLDALKEDFPDRRDWQSIIEAYGIWSRYRANRASVIPLDIDRMATLKAQILNQEPRN